MFWLSVHVLDTFHSYRNCRMRFQLDSRGPTQRGQKIRKEVKLINVTYYFLDYCGFGSLRCTQLTIQLVLCDMEHSSGDSVVLDVSGNIECPSNLEYPSAASTGSTSRSFASMLKLPGNLQLSAPNVREWLQSRRQNLRPWITFASTSKFQVPQNPQKWSKRVVKNIEHFQSNYMFVFLGLIVYCLITSPMLIIAIVANLGACHIASLKNAQRKLVIAGKEISLAHQYAAIGLLSFPIFYLAGATTAIFWVIGASFFVIMLHASFFNIDSITGSDEEPFDLQMEEV